MDSMSIGTLETAAPERFGASRSDGRTDARGIGTPILHSLACSADLADLGRVGASFGFKRTIRRSAAFDPAERHADAKAQKRAIALVGSWPKAAVMASCMILAFLISGGLVDSRNWCI
jgi:hypothetical protein